MTNPFRGFLAIALFFSIHHSLKSQAEALNFDGGDDFVQASSISFGTTWTAEAWIKPTNLFGNWNTVLGQCFYNGNQGFVIAVQNGSVFCDGPQGGYITTAITGGVWTHVALTYNNGIYAFYKNGILAGTKAAPFTNSSNPFYIGIRTNNNGVGLIDPYQGSIDEMRIWNTARTQCDIQRYMNCEIPTSFAGLVANYHFREGNGNGINFIPIFLNNNILTDHTGNGHTGTLTNFGLSIGGTTSNWTLNGPPAEGLTTPAVASTAEINVTGNGNTISDGSGTSLLSNYTDFGTAGTRTFIIQNTGTQTLNVTSPVFTGANASEFTVTVAPSAFLAAGTGTTSFVVAFTPTSLGAKTAVLNLYNSECSSEEFYTYVITATAVTAAALNFDGVDDYVETGANLAQLGQADFTMEAWIKTTGASEGIITFEDNDVTWEPGEMSFYLDAAGLPKFVGFSNGYINGNLAVNDGNWHHLAVVWDYSGTGITGVGKIYVDGVNHTASSGYSANNNNIAGGTFKIGKQNYNGFTPEAPNSFNGDIDEVRIYDRALCLDEILNNMSCEIPSPAGYPDLNGYYRFNQGIGFGVNAGLTSYTSLSVFANVATLTNFANSGPNSNWVSPGGVTSGASCTVYQHREINIKGNSTSIVSGDITPVLTDYTDFGSVGLGSILSRTFVIENIQTGSLSITGYNLTGAQAGSFTITTNPSASVAAFGTTSIVVSFSAAALGLRSANINITSDDCDEPTYTFSVQATGAPAAAALNFDGSGDAINTTDPVIGLSNFTIEGWIKPSALTGGFLVSSRYIEGFSTGYWFTVGYGSGYVGMEMAECGNGGGNYVGTFTASPGYSITPGTWGHFAIVRSGSVYSIYINGNLANTFTETASHNFDNVGVNPSHILNIGGWIQNNCCWFNGSMDELRIWKVARTQCEIQSFMNCEIAGTAPNLFSNYHFNQGADALGNPTITKLNDASVSGYSGNLNASFALTGSTSNWVAPGGVTSGNTASVAALIEIEVLGNSTSIPDGNATASAANFTDFNGVSSRTFVIQNTVAGGTLVIATPSIVGTNANQFSVTTLPGTSINGIGSTTFVVSFIPSSPGVKNATINISSNDCNESLYDFVITATAVTGAALHFDGVNDKANVASGINLNGQSFTIEFWAKRGVNGTNGLVVGQGGVGTNQSLQLGFRNSDHFTFGFYLNDMNYMGPQTTDGNFHHWACVYDASAVGKNRFIYCDGVLVLNDFSASAYLGTGAFIIGDAGYGSNPYNGTVDELRVWNKARTHCEIQTYMNCEIAGSQPSLTANYHFNQGVAAGTNTLLTSLTDDNTTPKNATFSGFALAGSSSNFVVPGAVTSGSTTPNPPTVLLSIEGNGNIISAGSSTPLLSNFSDFGTATTRTLVMKNIGTGPLYINGGTFTGTNASNFTVTTTPSSIITTGGSSSFVITFSPTAVGSQSAILSIFSNDCTNPTYSFVITASTSPAAALAFDGSDDYVSLSDPVFGYSDFTIEAWIKPNSFATNTYFISTRNNEFTASGQYFDFGYMGSSGQLYFETANDGTTPYTQVTSSSSTLTAGAWQHVAATRSGTLLNVYINGQMTASKSYSSVTNLVSNNSTIRFSGSGLGLANFNGNMDEVRIWNYPRTQCQILANMNIEIPTTAGGLMRNYHFNQGIPSGPNSAVTTLTDAAGAGFGTLTNFSLTGGSTSNWVSPGGVVSGNTLAVLPTGTITVSGNGNNVPIGVATSTTNFTDFSTASSRIFGITNPGVGPLYLNGATFSGANASNFSVTTVPSNTVIAGGTNSFVISFTPTAVGSQSAIITINSSDCANASYSFVITASTAPADALMFNGASEYVALPVNNFAGTNKFSFEAWIKPADITTNMYYEIMRQDINISSPIVLLSFQNNGSFLSFGLSTTAGYSELDAPITASYLTNGNWHHVAAVYDGSFKRIYLDGILIGTETKTGNITSGSVVHSLGRAPFYGEFFKGRMDEVRYWDVARTQCEIQSYMNCEIPGATTGLSANYHFTQGIPSGANPTATLLVDAAGANTGTLTSFLLTGPVSNWVSPGGVITGSITPAPPSASILVSGNSNSITPGSPSTSTLNFTDFAGVNTRTFVIQNSATGTLNISAPYFTGVNASEFSVSVMPTFSLGASATTSFVVVFTPTAGGFRTATLNIDNNDCSVPIFNCAVGGTPAAAAALNFDGSGDYANITDFNLGTGDFTMETWIKPTGFSSPDTYILSNRLNNFGSSGNWFNLAISSGKFQIELGQAAVGTNTAFAGTTNLVAGNWYHVAAVRSGLIYKLYVNGILETQVTDNVSRNLTGNFANAHIGGWPENGTPRWFSGNIDELRVWTTARTQCEIQSYMNCEIPANASSLIANYHFNQGAAALANPTHSTIIDATGTNNGSLNGFALSGAGSNWVSPGGVITGSITPAPPTASILVSGNSNSVTPGSSSTSTLNFTDFGSLTTRTFVIQNSALGTLNIGAPYFTGVNASEFSITVLPTLSLSASATTSFVVAFTPSTGGFRTATLNINNNDCSVPIFNCAIGGTPALASALNFDGFSNYIQTPIDADTDVMPNTTWEAWIYPTNTTGYRMIMAIDDNGWDRFLTLNGSQLSIATLNSGEQLVTTINANQWYHVAVVYKQASNQAFAYLNGIQYGPYTTAFPSGTSLNNLMIGANTNIGPHINFFEGKMDEVRVWNTARTQCEILTYMNCEIPSTASGLLANYHFNQGAAGLSNATTTLLTDVSGSTNTGTLTSFALTGTLSNWVAPGPFANGYTTSVAPSGTLTLYGNGNIIPTGVVTSTTNYTDFGTNTNLTYLIQNVGAGVLYVNNISFSGANAVNFSVTSLPSPTVGGSSNTPFTISFTPTAVGSQSAIVTINSADCTSPNYSFVITASTSPASALHFDGGSGYVNLGSGTNLKPTSAITAEAWVNAGNWPSTDQTFIGNTENNGWGLLTLNATGNLEAYLRRNGTWAIVGTPLSAISPGWHHVAMTYDGRYTKLYLDGKLKNLDDAGATYTVDYNAFNSTLIGAEASGGSTPVPGWAFTGSIDEVRIWNTARTQCEILTYMNCEIPTTASNLVANYHFNQGIPSGSNAAVTTLTDAAGSNTGTLVNVTLTGSVSNWVTPGGVVSGSITPAVLSQTLNVKGNGNNVPVGAATSTNNFTNFSNSSSRIFVAENVSTGTLYINSVTLSGANAAQFSVTSLPASSLAGISSSSFTIVFTPTVIGTSTATVSISSSDCTFPTYTFVITASTSVGSALDFDGANDYVDLGTSTALKPTTALTEEAWVYQQNWVGSSATFVGNAQSAGYTLRTNGTELRGFVYANSGFLVAGTPLTGITPGWHHVAFTYDGRYANLYLDGILKSSNDAGGVYPIQYVGNNMLLGAEAGAGTLPIGGYMNGKLDEVRIWNRALCQAEIQNYMTCEISSTLTGLVANYHFNHGIAAGVNPTVTTLADASGNGLDGILNSFSLTGIGSNWISPGAVISGSSCTAFTNPEINLLSGLIPIPDGYATPTPTNNTDFGNISTNSLVTQSYTIQNTGAANLSVASITLSGVNASQFTVGALSPASPVAPAGFAVFTVTFAPTSAGAKTATVNISNSDCDEGIYDFVITGTANIGAALTLDGTNDYVNCGNILTPSYTKEGWIRLSASLTNGNNLISGGSGSNGHALWAPGSTGNKLAAGHNLAWAAVQDPTPLTIGQWYHVAVSYDAPSQTMILYKNGLVVATNNAVPAFLGSDPLSIGAFSGNFSMSGAVDEVRIWNRPLCQSEIQNNMNCEIPTTAAGLIANYHFNQGVGYGSNLTSTLVTDASASAITGTLMNFAATGTLSNWISTSTITTGSSCAPITVSEINILGNALTIVDGKTLSTLTDNTDFGGICINTITARSYTIQNTGTANLTVSGITMSGANASQFNVGTLTPASPILPGGSAVFSVTFAPTSAGTKTAIVNIANNDCNESPYDYVLTATCNALPNVGGSATNPVICNGGSTTLNGSGATTYTWVGGTPAVTNAVAFSPTTTLTYTVVGTDALTGCTSTNLAVQTITVNPTPTITALSNSLLICNGTPVTFTASGAGTGGTYTSNPGAQVFTGNTLTVSPALTTTYAITGTSTNNCVGGNTISITVTVNALPTVTATTSNSVICNTGTTSLIGSGASTYTWTGGTPSVTNAVAFSPSTTISYTVSGTNALTGCTSTNLAVQTITVDPTPTITASSPASVICNGATATLIAGGASTYTWMPGVLIGATVTPATTTLTTYTVVGTSSLGCTSTNVAVQTISVNSLPTVTASISSSMVCLGSTVMVNGFGADTYSWTNSVSDGIAFTPVVSGIYSVTGTNTLTGCTSTNIASVSLTVNTLPTLTITSSVPAICIGGSVTLSGSGASTYTWSNSVSNNTAFTPTITTEYTLTASDVNTCTNSAVTTITVNNLPVLSIVASPSVSCEAESTTLTVSGGSSYTWSTSESTSSIVISPTATSVYSLIAVDANACTNSITYTQSVIICPGTFTAYATKQDVSCIGKDDGKITITASSSYSSSLISYHWNPSSLCSANNCDTIKNLPSGNYNVTVRITYTVNGSLVKTDSIALAPITLIDLGGPCEIKVFTGVSANNDGVNDVFNIDNIEEFPNNKVMIFNRWGQEVFSVKGYNNLDKAWPLKEELSKLSTNTYFYIIDLGNGSKPIKGWIELYKE